MSKFSKKSNAYRQERGDDDASPKGVVSNNSHVKPPDTTNHESRAISNYEDAHIKAHRQACGDDDHASSKDGFPGKSHDRGAGERFGAWMLRKLFYDRRDHELISIVNQLSQDPAQGSLEYTRKIYYPFFHPLGIKEFSESKGLRTAYSVVHLLNSLEQGDEERRLQALRGLRDEVIDTRTGPMPLNSARVLLQLMKELVRAEGDYGRQLELAHDFRQTASGKPGMIRKQLAKYHLLEMPESWHQITFDDHVHDANTKGRKTPTHLIMDAWIKGIRRLRVVYYHYLEPRFVSEVYEAARIMGIEVRIAVEFIVPYRDRFVSIHWVARGFPDASSFLCFLAEPHVMEFMEKGKAVMAYQTKYVLQVLKAFNTHHLDRFIQKTGIPLSPLEPQPFLAFVLPGQASILHLGEYIHYLCLKAVTSAGAMATAQGFPGAQGKDEGCDPLAMAVPEVSAILEQFLGAKHYPDISCPWRPCNGADVPGRLQVSLKELLAELSALHYSFRITLNLSPLEMEDVLELLYDGGGLITRLEIFNLKDYAAGHRKHIPGINALQQAINDGNPLRLKRMVRQAIHRVAQGEYPDALDRRKNLMAILHDLETFRQMYKGVALKSRIGSDSTGRSLTAYGMGLGIMDTLPFRARREILKRPTSRLRLPLHLCVYPSVTSIRPMRRWGWNHGVLDLVSKIPGLGYLGARKVKKWEVDSLSTFMTEGPGNIVSLGGGIGFLAHGADGKRGKQQGRRAATRDVSSAPRRRWSSLNSGVKNALKVLIGFIPAFTTFVLTKEWWVLAWFGAFIWFGITGLRNIAQSVLGGGGIARSPLLRWNDYVSWERLTDSLLFTGFSVPLLDYLVKTIFLDHGMGITVANQPVTLYAVMAMANGIYLASHNAFRGFSRATIFGNFFRSLFSIPIAILLSGIIGQGLVAMGVVGVQSILQKWAAVISKTASDVVAALIEGPADRFQNIALRTRDYKRKLSELFDVYARLELLFPEAAEFSLLAEPEKLIQDPNAEVRDLMVLLIIHALDLLYFWMYQPRARTTLHEMMERFSPEERTVFLLTQRVLKREQMVSRLLVDGILGRKFSKPLSFYLTRYEEYLTSLDKMMTPSG